MSRQHKLGSTFIRYVAAFCLPVFIMLVVFLLKGSFLLVVMLQLRVI